MTASNTYDVIVVGIGGMGSATVYELASRGLRVLGLEQFDIPHDQGSSHGVNRVIRLAYYEDPSYVPLMRRAYERWRDLETEAGEKLLYTTGSVAASREDREVFAGSLRSCLEHDLSHEVLTSTDLTGRFPGYRLPPDWMALLQPAGGFLLSERCIVNYVFGALELGAEVRAREPVLGWDPSGDHGQGGDQSREVRSRGACHYRRSMDRDADPVARPPGETRTTGARLVSTAPA